MGIKKKSMMAACWWDAVLACFVLVPEKLVFLACGERIFFSEQDANIINSRKVQIKFLEREPGRWITETE